MPTPANASIIPALRYRDAPAAIDWLGRAFGFTPHLVVPDDHGGIAHAQLTLGNGMIMLGTYHDGGDPGAQIKTPADVGANTQSPYIIIPEIDAHYRQAQQAGAEIVYPIADQPHGGGLYTARDPEGYLWNFGSYNPWAP